MGRLRDWWERLTDARQATPAPAPPAAAHPKAKPASEGLELADDSPKHRASRVGEAGFDPYASDAGYSKPHSWERVDHD